MPDRVAISNTSPIFYLHRIGHLYLLESIYQEVLIPPAVEKELLAGGAKGLDIPEMGQLPWLKVRSVRDRRLLPSDSDLGVGESEAIALSLEHEHSLLILDDALGRQVAIREGLRLTGTLGVLLRAKVAGLIDQIEPLLTSLRACGMRLSEPLIQRVLTEAGE